MISQDVLDRVLAAHDIVDVVGRYLSLKPAGRSQKALCPFHDEKTPSFTVNPDRQTFKCFGCGVGGDVFRFLMEHEGMTFPEAVRMLARERGIEVPERGGGERVEPRRYERALSALSFAREHFARALASPAGAEARAYLEHRGYDEEARRRFGLGCAPPGWDRLLAAARERKIPVEALDEAGLVLRAEDGRPYDRFRNRVVFPIADLQGRVVTFGARALSPEDQPKYLNGPETLVFKKANTLFHLDRAKEPIRRSGEALLMEGYTDVLMCHLHGFDRAVAGMGTAFTSRQAGLLKRFARRVVLVYDSDEAGCLAAERTLDVLVGERLEVRVARLPTGRDVDEVLLEEGPQAVEEILGGALDLLDFKWWALARRHDLGGPAGRARAAEELVSTLVRVPSPVERDQWLRLAAERLGGTGVEAALRQEAGRQVRRAGRDEVVRTRHREASREAGPGGPAASEDADPAARARDRNRRESEAFLLSGLVFFPALRDRILTAVGPEDFRFEVNRRIYRAVLDLEETPSPPAAGPAATAPLAPAWSARTLVARLAEDAEAQGVLAGLPEDPTLAERIPLHLEFLERRRRERRRQEELVRGLGGGRPPGVLDEDPGEPGPPTRGTADSSSPAPSRKHVG